MYEYIKHWSVISGSEGPRPIKMYLPAINKENIREEELPASLVLVNPDTGQSVADKDLSLSQIPCVHVYMCLHTHVHVYFTTIHAFVN